jgi:hypothetical protein
VSPVTGAVRSAGLSCSLGPFIGLVSFPQAGEKCGKSLDRRGLQRKSGPFFPEPVKSSTAARRPILPVAQDQTREFPGKKPSF